MNKAPHDRDNNPAMQERRNFLLTGAGITAASLLPEFALAGQTKDSKKSDT